MSESPLPNREGQKVPEVSFRVRRNGDWATVTTDELFGGRNVMRLENFMPFPTQAESAESATLNK